MAKAKTKTKKWYESVTLWANIVMIVGLSLQAYQGVEVMDASLQAGIVALINGLLRLKTGKPIALGNLAE